MRNGMLSILVHEFNVDVPVVMHRYYRRVMRTVPDPILDREGYREKQDGISNLWALHSDLSGLNAVGAAPCDPHLFTSTACCCPAP